MRTGEGLISLGRVPSALCSFGVAGTILLLSFGICGNDTVHRGSWPLCWGLNNSSDRVLARPQQLWRNMTVLSGSPHQVPWGTMYCPEYNRLRQLYEVAIRQWGHVILSPDTGSLIPFAAEIKEEAYRERDEAKRRLSDHMSTCPSCKPKRRSVN